MASMFVTYTRRILPPAVLLAMLAASSAATASAQDEKKATVEHPEVKDLSLAGVKQVEKEELLESLSITESRCVSLALKPFCLISKSPIFYKRAYLDRDELARDLIRARVFYWQRGYRDATVDTIVRADGRKAVKVTLVVNEGQPTRVSGVDLTQTIPLLNARDIRTRVLLKTGDPLNVFKLDTTRVRLRERLWEKGYSDARVDTSTQIDTAVRRATVTIKVDPRYVTRVREIEIVGAENVTQTTIRRSLSFEPGDVYRRSAVLESQRALYESNLFRRASIQVAGRRDSLKLVTVTVQEAPPRAVRLSVGFNTIDFAQVAARYTNYNWIGGARRLNLSGTIGNLFANQLNGNGIFYDVKNKTTIDAPQSKYFKPTYSASADVQQPWFGSPRNTLAFGIFAHRRSTPGIYIDQGYGTSATFTRLLTLQWPTSLNYRFEVTSVDASNVYFCVSNGVCDDATLLALRKNQRLSPLAFTTSLDRADDPYEPRKGMRARIDAEHASSFTISDYRYNRISSEASFFYPIGRRSVLASHVHGGYVNALASTATALDVTANQSRDLLHPRKRFYLGGATSVRGFMENQLGPRVLTISPLKLRGDTLCPATTALSACDPNAAHVADRDFNPRPLGGNMIAEASVEFRFPILGDFLGAVFVDGGYLAQNIDKDDLPKSRTAITPGIGARYLSPVGPIRVDIGWTPNRAETLTVITQDPTTRELVTLATKRRFAPSGGFMSHLTLHLSIGEAY
jgi:outer membrane protein insertion porin family